MYHFFVQKDQIFDEEIVIMDKDVNHIKNVLRLAPGTKIVLSDHDGNDYECSLDSLTNEEIRCKILSKDKSKSELPAYITLVQGAPKQDKMELIVQKAVELGVFDIIPVIMKRSIVKYDQKKSTSKTARWQTISESAAKQSKRGIIPIVHDFYDWKKLLHILKEYDKVIIPYENESGMTGTRRILGSISKGERVAVIIGPEGGFDEEEIRNLVGLGGQTISLGHRILRTETAGLASLAMISYQIEEEDTWQ
jgi:16S rRNA (uracil1498-N3)-methyltransferase